MTSKQSLSATEQLLSVIREGTSPNPSAPSKSPVHRIQHSTPHKITARAKSVIGVDLGWSSLRIALTRQTKKGSALSELHTFEYDQNFSRDSLEFQEFLKKKLSIVIGKKKSAQIWISMPSTDVHIFHLRIPKVSPKKIAITVFWSLQKERKFSEKDTFFDYRVLDEIQSEASGKTAILAYTAPRKQVSSLRTLFKKAGYPPTGISVVPFFLENIFRKETTRSSGNTVAHLFVGKDWSRIDIFKKGSLTFTRDIKTGTASMVENILEAEASHSVSPLMDLEPKPEQEHNSSTKPKMTPEVAEQILLGSLLASANSSQSDNNVPSAEQIGDCISPAVSRLARQLERTIQHFQTLNKSDSIDHLFLAGALCSSKVFIKALQRQIDIPLSVVDPLDEYRAGEILPGTIPDVLKERQAYIPSFGASLSSPDSTFNLLENFQDRQNLKKIHLIEKCAAGGIALCLLGFGTFAWSQLTALQTHKTRVHGLRQQIQSLEPKVYERSISTALTEIEKRNSDLQKSIKNLNSVALLAEFSNRTPPNVRLQNISIHTTGRDINKSIPAISISGIVFGESSKLETKLTEYLLELKKSPLLSNIVLAKKNSLLNSGHGQSIEFTIESGVEK